MIFLLASLSFIVKVSSPFFLLMFVILLFNDSF
jgi:hypothetical protein